MIFFLLNHMITMTIGRLGMLASTMVIKLFLRIMLLHMALIPGVLNK